MVDVLAGDIVGADAIQALAGRVLALGLPDTVLIAHGSLPDQAACQQNLAAAEEAQPSTARPQQRSGLEAFAQPMQQANAGTIGIIGSVAGDRGRKSNYVYGAAKGLVTRYTQGLQHRGAGRQRGARGAREARAHRRR